MSGRCRLSRWSPLGLESALNPWRAQNQAGRLALKINDLRNDPVGYRELPKLDIVGLSSSHDTRNRFISSANCKTIRPADPECAELPQPDLVGVGGKRDHSSISADDSWLGSRGSARVVSIGRVYTTTSQMSVRLVLERLSPCPLNAASIASGE